MKAQSQIFQYVLFFLIGLAMFGIIGNFYKNQAMSLRERVNSIDSQVYISAINSNLVKYLSECKHCSGFEFYMKFPNSTAGYYKIFELKSNPNLLVVLTVPEGANYSSSIHNFNETLNMSESGVSSVRTLNFSYIKKTNNLILVSK